MTRTLITALRALETDDRLFGALAILIVPAIVFCAAMVYGAP